MSKEPIITASQKKKRRGKLRPWQIDFMKSLKIADAASIIISITKKRPEAGEPITLKMDYNGKRLIPLTKK